MWEPDADENPSVWNNAHTEEAMLAAHMATAHADMFETATYRERLLATHAFLWPTTVSPQTLRTRLFSLRSATKDRLSEHSEL